MKKVMMVTALAALAAGAMAEDVVPSGNIVGYAKLKLKDAKSIMIFGAVFKDIVSAQKDLHIQSIGTDAEIWDSTYLSWWDGTRWTEAYWTGEWQNAETLVPINKTFAVGEGFRFASYPGDTVIVQGELYTTSTTNSDTVVYLQNAVEMFVNPMPAEVDIQDIGTSADVWDSAYLSWWDGTRWTEAYWTGEWQNAETLTPIDKVFAVGEGFRFASYKGDGLSFPNPLYVTPGP